MFGIPWLVFGVQHFMYADFVANLVPGYFPFRLFWAYLTGVAMFAAGFSLILNIKGRLAAIMLGSMLLIFVLLIHIPTIASESSIMNWTRALQDIAIASASFILAGLLSKEKKENLAFDKVTEVSGYAFALLLIVFGIHQFLNLDFLPAKIASYVPLRMLWVYLTGIGMIVTGLSVFIGRGTNRAALALGTFMLILNLLLHVYLLSRSLYNPLYWTAAMLDLTITCGVFFLASRYARKD